MHHRLSFFFFLFFPFFYLGITVSAPKVVQVNSPRDSLLRSGLD